MSTKIISEATMVLPFVLVVFLYKKKKDKKVKVFSVLGLLAFVAVGEKHEGGAFGGLNWIES
jgi:hypothetical protein